MNENKMVRGRKYSCVNKYGIKTELIFIKKNKDKYEFRSANGANDAKVTMTNCQIRDLIWQ